MRHRVLRLTASSVLIVLLTAVTITLLSGTHAKAGEVDDAWAALDAGDHPQALAHAVNVVEADGVTSASLLEMAQLALELESRDVCERVRAVGERIEEAGSEDAALGLALGYAYLGIAEVQLRTQTGGSGTSLLFADAESRAKAGAADDPIAAGLHARTRYAQGDLQGALAILAKLQEARSRGWPASLSMTHGLYLYENGAARQADTDGRPTPEARTELTAAVLKIEHALRTPRRIAPRARARAKLTRSWAHHRLGQYAEARSSYLDAHRAGGRSASYALRGLASLYARDREALITALEAAAAQKDAGPGALDALFDLHRSAKAYEAAIAVLGRRLDAFPDDPIGFKRGGALFLELEQWQEAEKHLHAALALDPTDDNTSFGIERVAQGLARTDFDRALAVYERLLEARPKDPYCRNNLGFLLRERVSPFTTFAPGGIQHLKPDAPAQIRKLLIRCRDAYASAVALIPEDEDESRDMMLSWNLAGIVNDYGLMVHYFADIQDAALAEKLYMRTLRMTEDSFKDTYSPNLQRLYRFVLKDRPLSWYQAARRCKEAILKERVVDGSLELVPDEAKRKAAASDEALLRARIVRQLKEDAAEDGAPWPPAGEGGSGR